MTVKINITPEEAAAVEPEEKTVKIEIVEKDKIEFSLNLRNALNGDLMIFDHKDIDIVVLSIMILFKAVIFMVP